MRLQYPLRVILAVRGYEQPLPCLERSRVLAPLIVYEPESPERRKAMGVSTDPLDEVERAQVLLLYKQR